MAPEGLREAPCWKRFGKRCGSAVEAVLPCKRTEAPRSGVYCAPQAHILCKFPSILFPGSTGSARCRSLCVCGSSDSASAYYSSSVRLSS